MDGTFYLDGIIIPGADEFLKKVRESGRDFFFFTNNSSNNVESCRTKLEKMGFPVDEKRVIISSHVTIDFLKRNRAGKTVFLRAVFITAVSVEFSRNSFSAARLAGYSRINIDLRL